MTKEIIVEEGTSPNRWSKSFIQGGYTNALKYRLKKEGKNFTKVKCIEFERTPNGQKLTYEITYA